MCRASIKITSQSQVDTVFKFIGNKTTSRADGGLSLDTLVINIGDKTIEIHEVEDYKNIVE